jgi:hypothetical protein
MANKEKPPSDNQPDKPSRTDQAREVVDEYANDQREIIKTLHKLFNW